MRFRILGSLEIESDDGRIHTLTRRQERCVLAILLLEAGRVVPVDRLGQLVWGDDHLDDMRPALYSHVARIRAAILRAGTSADRAILASRRNGYLLDIDPETVDAHRFRRLFGIAKATTDAAERYRLLHEALALWRGPALDRAAPEALRQRLCHDLDELRLHAVEESFATGLELGHHRELLPELARLAAESPVRERLAQFHMIALYQSGRTAEALDVYHQVRKRLADDLGLDPGSDLQRLHNAILRGDPLPTVRPLAGSSTPDSRIAPAQLPADQVRFVGRSRELRELDALLPAPVSGSATPVVISAIAGTAGVGKTALAVHWAHRVRSRFPDGQLYVNLRGHAAAAPLRPIDALAQFLTGLGIPGDRIPRELDQAASLYRTLLADRRLLVVLDNAHSVAQVRPLLPGANGCLALITSRNRLTGLVARDGAHRIDLDVLSPDEAVALLTRFLGDSRATGEPEAIATLSRLCAYLPLALRISAANLHEKSGHTIADYVAGLTAGDRLSALAIEDDEESAVRAVFDLSYAVLAAGSRQLFRSLSLIPGTDITVEAGSALTATEPADTAMHLDALAAAHLLTEQAPGRYSFHDLLREYAAGLTTRYDDDQVRAAAVQRLYGYYLRTATAAMDLLKPETVRLPREPEQFGQRPAPFHHRTEALAWLDRERPNLVAIVKAAAHARDPVAWQLGDALRGYFQLRVHIVDWLATADAGRAAAAAAGDRSGQAAAELSLANAEERHGRYPEAIAHYLSALEHVRLAGWTAGEAVALNGLGNVHQQTAQLQAAANYHRQSLALKRTLGDRRGEATSLCNLGNVDYALGRLTDAREHYAEAARLYEQTGSRNGLGLAHTNLGQACHSLGRLREAEDHLTHALTLNREVGNRWMEAETLRLLAETSRDAGEPAPALGLATEALAIARDVKHPWLEAAVLNTRGSVHQHLARTAEAIDDYCDARELAEQTAAREPFIEALIGLAMTRCHPGTEEQAHGYAQQALTLARDNGYELLAGRALTALAAVEFAAGHLDEAADHASQALIVHEDTGHQYGQVQSRLLLSRIDTGRQATWPRPLPAPRPGR